MARIARSKLGIYARRTARTGVLLLLGLALGGLDTATVPMAIKPEDTAAKTFTPAPGRSNIYVYREVDVPLLNMFQIMVDGQFVGGIVPKTYHLIEVASGLHVVSGLAPENQVDTQIFAEAGKSYFVIAVGLEGESIGPRVNLWQVREEEGVAGVLNAKRAAGAPLKLLSPINPEPAPEFLTQRDEILADPYIKGVIIKYYNSQKVWRRLRSGVMKNGLTTMRSISDLRFAGAQREYVMIQVKYKWYFGGPSNRAYPVNAEPHYM